LYILVNKKEEACCITINDTTRSKNEAQRYEEYSITPNYSSGFWLKSFSIQSFFVPLTPSKKLSLDNKNKNQDFCFVLCSFIRTFAHRMEQTIIEDNIFEFESFEEDGSVLMAVEHGYRVYILPNPRSCRTADFI
jgi:hypothetical protein